MAARVLVTGAGTGGSNSLIRSLKVGDPSLFVIGCHSDRFALKQSLADRNYLIPRADHPRFAAGLRHVIEREGVDLLTPESDTSVAAVSGLRRRIPCRVFLPPHAVVELCQDKYRLTAFLRERGLPVPLTYQVTRLENIGDVFRRLRTPLVWCRMRKGSGSAGAIPVRSAEQARAWIRYWQEMRSVPATSFTLSEYLPGRDFACQSLWSNGDLVLIKTCERLSYFGGDNHPSGSSSIASLAKIVREPNVVEVCVKAVRAVDRKATGAFSLDLKEDAQGAPRVTEINVGRLLTGTPIFDLAGKYNMAATYLRLALGEPVDVRDEYDVAEDYYMVRDLDAVPGVFHADEFFDGVEDARV